jgi:release factor glutamine methyltransferase
MELLRWTAEYLGEKGFHNARLNGEMLLSGVLGVKRLDLYLQFDRPLRPEELAEFKARLLRRAKREPLQYIEGEAPFRDLRLRVDPRVLIPRPETEQLVQRVLDWAAGRPGLAAADVGTGSGAIALALATEGPFERVVATDVEPGALEAARANHALAAPDSPVEFAWATGWPPWPASASTPWSPTLPTSPMPSAPRSTPRCATGSRPPRSSRATTGWR